MVKRRSTAEMLQSATRAGTAIQKLDRAVEEKAQQAVSTPANFHIAKILDRHQNTREIQAEHVQELMESIAVLGLLEPLVIDQRGRLLAGAHRRAAINQLKEQDPKAYEKQFPGDLIPVRLIDFDAEAEPELALQIEISENEKRRDYTPVEVRGLAEKLKAAGYVEVKGRPAKGQKALRPAVEVIIGKSIRTVRRYLNPEPEKSVTDVRLSETDAETTALKRLRSELTRWQRAFPEPEAKELVAMDKEIARLIRRIDRQLVDRSE